MCRASISLLRVLDDTHSSSSQHTLLVNKLFKMFLFSMMAQDHGVRRCVTQCESWYPRLPPVLVFPRHTGAVILSVRCSTVTVQRIDSTIEP
jgi:hypothetical protein